MKHRSTITTKHGVYHCMFGYSGVSPENITDHCHNWMQEPKVHDLVMLSCERMNQLDDYPTKDEIALMLTKAENEILAGERR